MVTFLITSLFIIGLLSLAIYFWQKPKSTVQTERFPRELERRSLFEAEFQEATKLDNQAALEAQRQEIINHARAGQKNALKDALSFGDSGLYEQALDLLVEASDGPLLVSLVSYVSRNELPVSISLARKLMQSWRRTPDRNSTARMLHVAALASDARVYREAVELAVDFWRNGQVDGLSGQELRTLIDGEFWLLPLNERSSGAGFTLKQTLTSARRELAAERLQNRAH